MAAYRGTNRGKNTHRHNPFEDELEDDFEHVDKDLLQRQMRDTQQRSLDSTKRSLALIEDSHDVAIKTAEELQYQGEQLNRIESNLDAIHEDMAVANRHISSMKSVFNTMTNYFKKPPKQTASHDSPLEPERGVGDMLASSSFPTPNRARQTGQNYPQVNQISSSASTSHDPYERELNENLSHMSRGLGRLKEDALVLGQEVDRQNEQLPRITMKTDIADIKVTKARKEVQKLLK
ncbi:synaptosomal-associated protein 29-like [Actinia tenebrosa]|uniref:Synaptosomal-associated protein 29-like n=1 Tax=Actinia tenebrosa TaxID=6105 RepID=A0A6P8HRS0_ACTTE|nr:synaptosomal-associated protein 29-like [Actinia tenebrosa]